MSDGRHTFSVGVDDATDNMRREVFDAIAQLAGRKDRMGNHCMCFERLIASVHELKEQSPEIFAVLFGEGDVRGA